MNSRKIVLLAGKGDSTNIVYNFLEKNFSLHATVIENSESKKIFLKRRIKRLGLPTVLGQILFSVFVSKSQKIFSKKRVEEIGLKYDLDFKEIPSDKMINVNSINSEETLKFLKSIQPDLIIVNGTRIISKKVLRAVDCKFINIHAGITPDYRGVHGTYWALAMNDAENSGVTVHYVDEGIDTGNVIDQIKVKHTKADNFSTYPFLQLAEGLNLLLKTIDLHFQNKIILKDKNSNNSKLWYHPTLWQYIYYRISRDVK